ncbi:hypothetical protein PPYR_00479 [Photinus pyralis]|uniref:Uncharacterized protein n=1 Tax=Photinus pyralis TaxID=7054 RepID=A0A5N4B1N3_PHOPY|nr:hypothetical protein PPYR_00479 [Photinus pyralis]
MIQMMKWPQSKMMMLPYQQQQQLQVRTTVTPHPNTQNLPVVLLRPVVYLLYLFFNKLEMAHECKLENFAFYMITEKFGSPAIDLFAITTDAEYTRFVPFQILPQLHQTLVITATVFFKY